MSVWKSDASHAQVEFSVRHMMFARVRGRFNDFEITLEGEPSDLTSAKLSGKVNTASIDTNEKDRDNHLRSADFFEVERFPEITFESRKITARGDGKYTLEGDLTIRDVTRPVTFDLTCPGVAKDPWGNERTAISATTTINRKDFGLTWNAMLEAGGVLVGDEVEINIDAEFVKQAQ